MTSDSSSRARARSGSALAQPADAALLGSVSAEVVAREDYLERVYAGLLGKVIGVYVGAPIEAWSYERIMREFGEVDYYLNDRRPSGGGGRFEGPLVRPDDDITGTLTFVRAVADHGSRLDLEPQDVAETWLNYVIENRTVLWWGGRGNSTEHTAFLRLKEGVPAPLSGSTALNGPVVSQQIGSQIFIDCWGMLVPGDARRAAALAETAASVSHDEEAIYAAQVVAVLESMAFVESSIDGLYDAALAVIPAESTIARLIRDVRSWCDDAGDDWHAVRAKLAAHYGYDRYPGVCHVVPNHGVVTMALLMSRDDFSRGLTIANTAGWDTDCNSATVGCVLGIKNGLAGIDAGPADWRGPVADRLYLPTADGGRSISDLLTESVRLAEVAATVYGVPQPAAKGGARYSFALPGAVQGFAVDDQEATVSNVAWRNAGRALRLDVPAHRTVVAATPTFIPEEARTQGGYELLASPLVYPGQTVYGVVGAREGAVRVRLVARHYAAGDTTALVGGDAVDLTTDATQTLEWTIPDLGGYPVMELGLEVQPLDGTAAAVLVDRIGWRGEPNLLLDRPQGGGRMWRRAWVDAVDHFEERWPEPYRIAQNRGVGLLSQGGADWRDYRVSSRLSSTGMRRGGLAVRVQGLRRYYAAMFGGDGELQIVRQLHSEQVVLASAPFAYTWAAERELSLTVRGSELHVAVDGSVIVVARDPDALLEQGGVALVVDEGCLSSGAVRVEPAP